MFAIAGRILAANALQRVITFLLNQVMIRHTSPEVFGQAAISLELLLSTLLFLSREGIRLACLREKVTSVAARQRLVNLSWVPSAVLVGVVGALFAMRALGDKWALLKPLASFDVDVVAMYALGAFLELCGEPWFNAFQSAGLYTPRLRADTAAVFVRSVVTCYTVAWLGLGVRGFGYAQVSYGLTHFIAMAGASRLSTRFDGKDAGWADFLPQLAPPLPDDSARSDALSRIVDTRTASVAVRAAFSSLLKHLLTEADKIALSLTTSAYDQGIFAVANNYGSLVARLILLPIEESARLTFSGLAADLRQALGQQGSNPAHAVDGEGDARQRAAVTALETQLDQLLLLVTLVGTAFAVFGPCYARVAVRILFGRQYQSDESVRTLAMICVNVLVLAWNGVSEAFVHAVMPPSAFLRMNAGFVASSVAYVVLVGPCVARAGTGGLVAAGAASMLLRIASSVGMIAHILAGVAHARPDVPQRWKMMRLLLRPSHLAAVSLAAVVTVASSNRFASSDMDLAALIQHVGVGAASFALYCAVAAWNVRSTGSLSDITPFLRPKKKET